MPSAIPYSPGLHLGSVVNAQALTLVQQISAINAPVDAAQDRLNSLVASKRSLERTKDELQNLDIPTHSLIGEIGRMQTAIDRAAADFAKDKNAAESRIHDLQEQIRMAHAPVESPIDYIKTEIKSMPLAPDGLNLDVQYFSLDSKDHDSSTYANSISSYVAASTQLLGLSASSRMSRAAREQVNQQLASNDIQGSLILSVTCTHSNASVLAPCQLDIDKAMEVWNHMFPDERLDPNNSSEMLQLADSQAASDAKFCLVSGVTYGSSIFGMVHISKTADPLLDRALAETAASMQSRGWAGGSIEGTSGRFGDDASFGPNVKELLGQPKNVSHVSLLSAGISPPVMSYVRTAEDNTPALGLGTSTEESAELQHREIDDRPIDDPGVEQSRIGSLEARTRKFEIESDHAAWESTTDGKDKVLDINSIIRALEDHMRKTRAITGGVPINLYLKEIDRSMLAQMWAAKYSPNE